MYINLKTKKNSAKSFSGYIMFEFKAINKMKSVLVLIYFISSDNVGFFSLTKNHNLN